MRAALVKGALGVVLVLGVASYAASFLPLAFLQPAIERSIERSLGRRVEIGEVHLDFLTGPGVALERVTIHEDPRAGVEPFAYAESVQARLDLLALLRGRVNFSSLRFDDASLNLVKPDNAPWNFQMLLAGGSTTANAAGDFAPPAIKMRAGRVNLKFGETKSVIYFDDTDLDVSSRGRGILDVRFSGVPARTDRPTRNLEHFFVRGTYDPAAVKPLQLQAELEPSPLDDVAHLFSGQLFPLKGSVAITAEISGAPADLEVKGDVHLDTGPKWSYQGRLNIPDQQLQLESVVDAGGAAGNIAPAPVRFHVWDILSVPHWEATLEQAPLKTFLTLARVLGAPIPDSFSLEGAADGAVAYRDANGLDGKIDVRDLSAQFSADPIPVHGRASVPGTETVSEVSSVSIHTATVLIQSGRASFEKVQIDAGTAGKLEAAGDYNLNGQGDANLRINSGHVGGARIVGAGFDLAGVDARMLSFVPLLNRVSQGIWKGSASWARDRDGAILWSGNYELANARLKVDGLADPLRIQSASVNMKDNHFDVTHLSARAGRIPFTGEYHFSLAVSGAVASGGPNTGEAAVAAQTFRLQTGAVSAGELERLLTPALVRGGGFLEKTLGLGSPETAPGWLTQRNVEGQLSVQALTFGDAARSLKLDSAHVVWNGTSLAISAIRASMEDAALSGDLTADLSGPAPTYHFSGKIAGVPYKAGRIDVDGSADAAGVGLALLSSFRARGTFRGQGIAFSPEAEFKKAAGSFELRVADAAPSLILRDLELTQGSDTFSGTGSAGRDGKFVLDLTGGGHQVHYTGSLDGDTALPRPTASAYGAPAGKVQE